MWFDTMGKRINFDQVLKYEPIDVCNDDKTMSYYIALTFVNGSIEFVTFSVAAERQLLLDLIDDFVGFDEKGVQDELN